MLRFLVLVIGLVLLLALNAYSRIARGDQEREETRVIMRAILENMQVVLPLSVSDEALTDPKNQPVVRAALRALADNADALVAHNGDGDPSIGFLGQPLAREAAYIARLYELGRTESAKLLLQETTQTCVACHTRLPDPARTPLADGFIDETALEQLAPAKKAELQAATRRFDEALSTYESLFDSPRTYPVRMLDLLTNYLVISIRVKGDFHRPIPVLEKLSQRADLWRNLRLNIERWIVALRAFEQNGLKTANIATARALIGGASRKARFPADRTTMIDYITASSVLYRYVENHPDADPANLAEAYYLLGVTEYHIQPGRGLPQSQILLEAAMRTAPSGPFAELAYTVYEEQVILGYTGSSGTHLPEDIREDLADLRRLVGIP